MAFISRVTISAILYELQPLKFDFSSYPPKALYWTSAVEDSEKYSVVYLPGTWVQLLLPAAKTSEQR